MFSATVGFGVKGQDVNLVLASRGIHRILSTFIFTIETWMTHIFICLPTGYEKSLRFLTPPRDLKGAWWMVIDLLCMGWIQLTETGQTHIQLWCYFTFDLSPCHAINHNLSISSVSYCFSMRDFHFLEQSGITVSWNKFSMSSQVRGAANQSYPIMSNICSAECEGLPRIEGNNLH